MKNIFSVIFSLLVGYLYSSTPKLIFKENKGQWPNKVLFASEFANTKFYVNTNSFNYCIYDADDIEKVHLQHQTHSDEVSMIHGHNYEVEFINAEFKKITKNNEQKEYFNYFLGNDKSKWASDVKAYKNVSFSEIYPNIDMDLYSTDFNIKYDFIVKKGADLNVIQLQYKYINDIDIIDDALIIKTSVGNVTEYKPSAYQLINGKRKDVLCRYLLLNDNTIGFNCPDGYNKNYDLIIDPVVLVASFSGSTTFARGAAATYDENGNIYNIGVTGASNYPTTLGAFQNTVNSLEWNFIVSAYNNTGSVKLFSTFLGGDSLDYPINMVVKNNIINIFGTSNSKTFPVTSNAYDTTCNGKVDFVISKLNITGTNLIASTYLGGSGNEYDGAFAPQFFIGPGNHFDVCSYGEMVCDAIGNVYVNSSTASLNFPVSVNAISLTRKGTVDACAFKLNNTLSNLDWSTYLGGTGREQGSGIRLESTGGVYCFGTTNSANFPVTLGCYQSTKMPNAGASDFYVTHINSTGTSIIASTFVGTVDADISGLIDIDQNNDIYICGNTFAAPSFTPTPGVYSNPNGKNVIYKLNPSLSSSYFKTKFGSVNSAPNIDPYLNFTAFKIDSCGEVYVAGYSDKSLPTTSNAFQPYGGGITDIYMAVFNPNCSSLFFASYYGGADTSKYYGEQTEGGISYFDNKGVLYQAVSSSGAMPTTLNAYSNTFNILTAAPQGYYDNFNDAFLKVDFQTFVNATSSYGANITGCQPFNAQFTSFPNTEASSVNWNFGDGSSNSNQTSVSHLYPNLGNYDVTLVVTDTNTCNRIDSIKTKLSVILPAVLNLGEDKFICENSEVVLRSNVTGVSYLWSTQETSQDIVVDKPGNYSLTIDNGGCTASDDINIIFFESSLSSQFPNVVTPNNDKVNDEINFTVYNLAKLEFILFDRWGNERYKTNDVSAKWSAENCQDGTYFYVLNYISNCSQDLKKIQGFISVFK